MNRTSISLLALSMTLIMPYRPLLATEDEAATALKEVVVTAPAEHDHAQHQMGEKQLAPLRHGTDDTAKMLSNLPGMSNYGAGGVSALPVLDGMGDDRLRIQVDGMDLVSSCANHMNPPLSYIAPGNVGSITVFNNVSPVSVGGDSLGGAIKVDSRAPEFAKPGQGTLFKGEGGAHYNSNGDGYGANLTATLANEKASMTYSGSTAQSDNYKAARAFKAAATQTNANTPSKTSYIDGDEVASSMYKSDNHAINLALRSDERLLELKLGVQQIPYQGFPNQRMDMTDNQSEQINLHHLEKFQWGQLDSRLYREHTRHSMNYLENKVFWYGGAATIPGMPMETEGTTIGAIVKADITLANHDILRVGTEYQRYRLDDWWPPSGGGMAPDTFQNINNGQRDRFDLFTEWEKQWNPQWSSLFGIRSANVVTNTDDVHSYDDTAATYTTDVANFNARDHKRTDHNVDITASTRFIPDSGKTFDFAVAQKTRSPNLYERYAWSHGTMASAMVNFAGDGNGYVGNLDLNPEIARTVSITADWHDPSKKWGVQITPYYSKVEDFIDARQTTTSPANSATGNNTVLEFVNQDATLYGIDIAGFLPLFSSPAYGDFSAKATINYVRGKNDDSGDNLYNIMPLNGKVALDHQRESWGNTMEWQLVDGKSDVSTTRKEVKTAGFGLLNWKSHYDWQQFRFGVGVENILDQYYEHPLAGLYLGQGRTMSMSMADAPKYGLNVPGPGRSYLAEMSVKF
ncbi:MAG: TonB-dependent receptor plug domain-containing protein [Magnetococcales bacterium]|nr:TonB-dependent receptor plug domain-containing protein [Magnetococcales bacterium]MBF0115811.1 TonB-dependent receptor plug domain-containing protein [Magnetococcales bacterium]